MNHVRRPGWGGEGCITQSPPPPLKGPGSGQGTDIGTNRSCKHKTQLFQFSSLLHGGQSNPIAFESIAEDINHC